MSLAHSLSRALFAPSSDDARNATQRGLRTATRCSSAAPTKCDVTSYVYTLLSASRSPGRDKPGHPQGERVDAFSSLPAPALRSFLLFLAPSALRPALPHQLHGVLEVLAGFFRHGHRQSVLPHCERILALVMAWAHPGTADGAKNSGNGGSGSGDGALNPQLASSALVCPQATKAGITAQCEPALFERVPLCPIATRYPLSPPVWVRTLCCHPLCAHPRHLASLLMRLQCRPGAPQLRKLLVKVTSRVGLALLPPRVAAWRYNRGSRSLVIADTPTPALVPPTGEAGSTGIAGTGGDAEAEEELDEAAMRHIGPITSLLLDGLRDKVRPHSPSPSPLPPCHFRSLSETERLIRCLSGGQTVRHLICQCSRSGKGFKQKSRGKIVISLPRSFVTPCTFV